MNNCVREVATAQTDKDTQAHSSSPSQFTPIPSNAQSPSTLLLLSSSVESSSPSVLIDAQEKKSADVANSNGIHSSEAGNDRHCSTGCTSSFSVPPNPFNISSDAVNAASIDGSNNISNSSSVGDAASAPLPLLFRAPSRSSASFLPPRPKKSFWDFLLCMPEVDSTSSSSSSHMNGPLRYSVATVPSPVATATRVRKLPTKSDTNTVTDGVIGTEAMISSVEYSASQWTGPLGAAQNRNHTIKNNTNTTYTSNHSSNNSSNGQNVRSTKPTPTTNSTTTITTVASQLESDATLNQRTNSSSYCSSGNTSTSNDGLSTVVSTGNDSVTGVANAEGNAPLSASTTDATHRVTVKPSSCSSSYPNAVATLAPKNHWTRFVSWVQDKFGITESDLEMHCQSTLGRQQHHKNSSNNWLNVEGTDEVFFLSTSSCSSCMSKGSTAPTTTIVSRDGSSIVVAPGTPTGTTSALLQSLGVQKDCFEDAPASVKADVDLMERKNESRKSMSIQITPPQKDSPLPLSCPSSSQKNACPSSDSNTVASPEVTTEAKQEIPAEETNTVKPMGAKQGEKEPMNGSSSSSSSSSASASSSAASPKWTIMDTRSGRTVRYQSDIHWGELVSRAQNAEKLKSSPVLSAVSSTSHESHMKALVASKKKYLRIQKQRARDLQHDEEELEWVLAYLTFLQASNEVPEGEGNEGAATTTELDSAMPHDSSPTTSRVASPQSVRCTRCTSRVHGAKKTGKHCSRRAQRRRRIHAPFFNETNAHEYVESCRNAAAAASSSSSAAGVSPSSHLLLSTTPPTSLPLGTCPSCWLSELDYTGGTSSSEDELYYSSCSRGSSSDTSEDADMECEDMLDKPVREKTRLESCYLRSQHVDLLVDEVDMQEADMELKSDTPACSNKNGDSEAGHLSSSSEENSGSTAELVSPHLSMTEDTEMNPEERRREHFQWWLETKDTPGTRNVRSVGKKKRGLTRSHSSSSNHNNNNNNNNNNNIFSNTSSSCTSRCSCRSKSPPTAAPLGGTSAVAARTTPIPSSTRSTSPTSTSSSCNIAAATAAATTTTTTGATQTAAASALSKFTMQVTKKSKENSLYPLQSREYMENVLLGQRRQQELALKMLLAESMRNAWEAELQRVQLYMYYLYDECEEEMRYFDYQYFVFQFKCDWDQLFLDVDEYLKQPNSMVSYCATILHAMELFQRFHKVQQDVARAKDRVRQRYEALQQYQMQLQLQQQQQQQYYEQQEVNMQEGSYPQVAVYPLADGIHDSTSTELNPTVLAASSDPTTIPPPASSTHGGVCSSPNNIDVSHNAAAISEGVPVGGDSYNHNNGNVTHYSTEINILTGMDNAHHHNDHHLHHGVGGVDFGGYGEAEGEDEEGDNVSLSGKTPMTSSSLYDWSVATNASNEAYLYEYGASGSTTRAIENETSAANTTSTAAAAAGITPSTVAAAIGSGAGASGIGNGMYEGESMAHYYYSSAATTMQNAIAEENTMMMMMECNDSFCSSVNSNVASPFHSHHHPAAVPPPSSSSVSATTPMTATDSGAAMGSELQSSEHAYAYAYEDGHIPTHIHDGAVGSSQQEPESSPLSSSLQQQPQPEAHATTTTASPATTAAELTIDCDPSPVYVPLSWFRAQDTDVRVEVYGTRRDRKIRCMQRRNLLLERRCRRRNQTSTTNGNTNTTVHTSVPITNINSSSSATDITITTPSDVLNLNADPLTVSESSCPARDAKSSTSTVVASSNSSKAPISNKPEKKEEVDVDTDVEVEEELFTYSASASLGCLRSLAPAGPCEETTLLNAAVSEAVLGKKKKKKDTKADIKPAGTGNGTGAGKVSTITHITIPRNQSFQASRSRGSSSDSDESSSGGSDAGYCQDGEGLEGNNNNVDGESDGKTVSSKKDGTSGSMQSPSTRSRRLAHSGRTSNISSRSSKDRMSKRPMQNIVQVGCFGLTFFSRYE